MASDPRFAELLERCDFAGPQAPNRASLDGLPAVEI